MTKKEVAAFVAALNILSALLYWIAGQPNPNYAESAPILCFAGADVVIASGNGFCAAITLITLPQIAFGISDYTAKQMSRVDQVSAFNAGYDARYKHEMPRSSNPYPPKMQAHEWWDCGWSWKGWMPDWREF